MKQSPIYIVMYILSLLVACDTVHEFPEGPVKPVIVPFTLHLKFDTVMPLYKTVYYNTKAATVADDYDVRYIINAYRSDNGTDFDREVDAQFIITKDSLNQLDHTVHLDLEEGYYKFMVWTDYIYAGGKSDTYYTTTDFSEVILKEKDVHYGSNDFRDAYRGSRTSLAAAITTNPVGITNEDTVYMKRPMAKFKFISTDLNEFVTRVLQLEAEKGHVQEETKTINPDDYNVIFRYTGFMPCSFNLYTDKPADAWSNIFFESKITLLDEHEAELGFDYVFVTGEIEASVSVAVEVYNKEGEQMAGIYPIDVPLKQGELTIVRGAFLTSKATGGIGIDPSFEGDFNFIIP